MTVPYMDNITGRARTISRTPYDIAAFERFKIDLDGWIHSSVQPVAGLPQGQRLIVTGMSDAFNQTYILYDKIGVFHGEYGYHKLYLGDRVTTDLDEADAIIISHPFSADGMSSHDKIAQADKLGKPIFVDCAFFGICANISFDFTAYKNIHTVGFSLSKTFGTGPNRVGMIYTIDRYAPAVYAEWNYPLIAGAMQHYDLLATKTPDETFATYRNRQVQICDELGVVPSDTVIFGIDMEGRYPEFKRGYTGRLCISDVIIEQGP